MNTPGKEWIEEIAIPALNRATSVNAACAAMGVSKDALRHRLNRHRYGDPSRFVGVATSLKGPTCAESEVARGGRHAADPPRRGPLDDDMRRLVDATRSGPVAFDALCDRLDLSPKRARDLVERARSAGASIDVAHDHVGIRHAEPTSEVVDAGVAPTVGQRQIVAVISDTHFGSKYCMREQIRDFVRYAYDRGAREFLHTGDWNDGRYKHGMFELTHSGIEDQTRDSFETLPELPGASYFAVSGNHDDTFADETGMAPGDYIEWYFREHGRNDVKFYGRRGAYVKLRGAIFELWHPKKAGGYALSYMPQNHIRDYGVGRKPDFLLIGHTHTAGYFEQRGVHALLTGTFQGGGSAFSKSLGGAPSIGGTIISYELTETRTLRRVSIERSAYFEREDPRALECA
jgi:predicted phosphodiesterase